MDVAPDVAPTLPTPADHLDPVWDHSGDSCHWTHYISVEQAMDWLSMADTRKLELARAAEAKAEIYRQSTRSHR